ncbi:hypothetical protein DFH29DRAFT_1076953 [Suillus ampliporus]|nr:hypothetical protein DFH29DRAFT_1076953 [Suillus ampliporus]
MMKAANPNVKLSRVWDIIGELQSILACRSQVVTIPNLETPYSRAISPTTNFSSIELKDQDISAIITARQQQLDAVSDEISGLETVMRSILNLHQQLVEKTDKITQSMNLHKRLISALWRMPTEILSQIFHHCLPDFYSLPLLSIAPLLLTRVCRRWREVAIGTPNLWCKLHVSFAPRDHWEQQALCYHSWLKRSRGCPISLNVSRGGNDLTKLQSLLQPYVDQIASLCIDVLDTDQPQLLLENLPALQELIIYIETPEAPPHTAQYISRLPFSLRTLRVIGPCFGLQDIYSFNPVWTHLTNVEIDIYEPDAVPHLLQLGPNLSSLVVHMYASSDETLALQPSTQTKLQSLCITFEDAKIHTFPNLLDALSLPNLRVLDVDFVTSWPHEAFMAFLVRSNCPLENLIFHARIVVPTDEQRAEYVALIPSLKFVQD